MFKLVCFSDSHGILPDIPECDLVLISGDIMPLEVQRNFHKSYMWLTTDFTEWIEKCKCKKIYMVAGNHDFYFQYYGNEFMQFIKNNNLENKFCYLEDNIVVDETTNFSICGIPWVSGPAGWAFYTQDCYHKFESVDNIDILICHQPPKYKKIGCSYPNTRYEKDWGCEEITEALKDKHIKLLCCGHIHTGEHKMHKMNNIHMFNVSLLDEDYKRKYPLLTLTVDGDCEIKNAD